MDVPRVPLADDAARRAALVSHDRSLLVEAGAGSGKTAVMAGRIVMMLAEGVLPRSIVAVTFTELAASELVMRVREFVDALLEGKIPTELHVVLADGMSEAQRHNLEAAAATMDDITSSTIHGFCRRLVKPYPAEADIDPGAEVMDRDQTDLVFVDIVDGWLRERLSGDEGGLIAEMAFHDPARTVSLIHVIVGDLRRHRTVTAPPAAPLAPAVREFRERVDAFNRFLAGLDVTEEETAAIVDRFTEMAEEVGFASVADDPASLMRLLLVSAHPGLCTAKGDFSAYRRKGKWKAVAKRAGLAEAEGGRLHDAARDHYGRCGEAWKTMLGTVASRVLSDVIAEVQPVLQRYRDYKRSAALLDFEDLILAARDLLRDHDYVRCALARRHTHVLVDELQDTDPLQVEIFWRLCGEPPDGDPAGDWRTFRIRPGALFLVGDPKQAIYRFRGADVGTYVWVRDAYKDQDVDSVLSISTNFRSAAPILAHVNGCFEGPLSSEGQPGFTKLDPSHPAPDGTLCVAALDVAVADEDGRATAEQQREGEAKAVAELCARLIGSETILDLKTGERRLCQAGDIALLVPTGRNLWYYEEALEGFGVPVATQAGKRLFRCQEIQDLIALTRVLADRRDTLALGALLRGPLVGLTEEELLDIVWTLPRSGDDPDALPRLDLGVDPETVQHPLARDVLERLQSLHRRANSTTPHDILSRAVAVLRVRPILLRRHRGRAERAFANVDLYLNLARAYPVRGLRAFAGAMAAAWADELRAVEGRPDAPEEAVALYTMHVAKGLEWPIVIPVNTMTRTKQPDPDVIDRERDHLHHPVFGVRPRGYRDAYDTEKAERDQERIRLWYVAATRARNLLVLPRLDIEPAKNEWRALLDLSLDGLPAIDVSHPPIGSGAAEASPINPQTPETFQQEARAIAERQRRLVWSAPSRDEDVASPAVRIERPDILVADDDEGPLEGDPSTTVQASQNRGRIIHKLFEEVLTGETDESAAFLAERAATLIRALGEAVVEDPEDGLSPDEIAGCITRTLALPEIAELRPTLVPEFTVYASEDDEGEERVAAGIVDAAGFGGDGRLHTIIDWKSEVDPRPATAAHYQAQIQGYMRMTGATTGLLVFVTNGTVVRFSN